MIPNEMTPTEITPKIERFSKTLGSGLLSYVPIHPSPTAMQNNCHCAVDEMVAVKGGSKVLGWKIWECDYWIKAVYHAVWRTPKGELVDVTPEPGERETLFVVDHTKRKSVYVTPRVVAKKSKFKKSVAALTKVESLQMRINERANHGGTVPMAGEIDPRTLMVVTQAQTEFIRRLAIALSCR